MKRKLASNAIYLFINQFSLVILSFIFWWFLGKTLKPAEYGIVSTSINTALLFSAIVVLGFPTTFIKLIPEYLGKKQEKKINSLIKFSFKIGIISTVIGTIFLFALSSFFATLLNINVSVFWIIIIIMIVYSFSQLSLTILSGFQNMKRIAISRPVGNLAKLVFTVILIYLGFSYFGPLLGFILQSLLILLINFPLKHFIGPSDYINKKYIMINYVMQAFFISLLWISLNQTPYIILTILKNNTATGIFTVASVITSEISVIPGILSDSLFPIISQLCINKNAKKNQCYLINLVFRYGLFIMLPMTVFLITFSKPIILFYSSSDYLQAQNLFPILSIASLIFGCGIILLNNLFAIGKPKTQRNILIVTSLSFLLLSIPLTIIFSALGISLAYSISVIILSSLSFYYIKKYVHFNIPFNDIKKLLAGSIVSLIFLYFMSLFVRNLYLGIILFFVACFIYLIILIPLKFFKEDDIMVINYIEKKSPILKKELNKIKNFLSKFVEVSN